MGVGPAGPTPRHHPDARTARQSCLGRPGVEYVVHYSDHVGVQARNVDQRFRSILGASEATLVESSIWMSRLDRTRFRVSARFLVPARSQRLSRTLLAIAAPSLPDEVPTQDYSGLRHSLPSGSQPLRTLFLPC